jgi:tetratricopeptide (TPR) repeat protein
MDSNCLDAVIGLAQLLKLENNTTESIKLYYQTITTIAHSYASTPTFNLYTLSEIFCLLRRLENYLEKFNTDYMHVALAQVLMSSEKYNEALAHFNAALEFVLFHDFSRS